MHIMRAGTCSKKIHAVKNLHLGGTTCQLEESCQLCPEGQDEAEGDQADEHSSLEYGAEHGIPFSAKGLQ